MGAEIRIYDTLSKELKPLEVRDPGRVGIYACGPTVYSRIHIGNARPYVVFMLFKRLLEHDGYDVRLVINITDVNDKIYDAAAKAGVESAKLAAEMADAYRADTDALGLGRPDEEPLATETMTPIVELIKALIDSEHAYESGGDVYFAVRTFPGYGKLSNRRLDEMSSGDQGEPDDATDLKRDPLDFALWKAHKEGEDTAWDSPWGKGRPGWHIECSAMAETLLGCDFDIHGGGLDLVFPHHENEIAQTQAGRGRRLARIWMHNGMIQLGEEKMAKSVGNIQPLHEVLERYGRDAVIMYFVLGHYRRPIVFSDERMQAAQQAVERVRNLGRLMDRSPQLAAGSVEGYSAGERDSFFDELRNDFNTAAASGFLFRLIREGNARLEAGKPCSGLRRALVEMTQVLGLENLLQVTDRVDADAQALAEERERARQTKDFARADEIRDELAARGYEIRDTSDGPVVVRSGT